MIGLDTNVLMRFFAQDDPKHSPIADAVMASLTPQNPGWVGLVTVLELVWVMSNRLSFTKTTVCSVLERLLVLDSVVVEQDLLIASAVQMFRACRADFADCLIAICGKAAGCTKTVTFDRIAAKDLGMELLG